MGEINLNSQTIVDELVGIVGMLSNRDGSTVKDITIVLESLHGPVRQDVIQDGLEMGVLSGVLECKYRRYKVCRQKNIANRNSLYDVAGCSSWEDGLPRDTDSFDDALSLSSQSAQTDLFSGGEISHPPSLQEILSVKSIQSSDKLSSCSNQYGSRDEVPKVKERKRKETRPIIVKLPLSKKSSTVKGDSDSVSDKKAKSPTVKNVCDSVDAKKVIENQKETSENIRTPQLVLNNKDDQSQSISDKNRDSNLSAQRSMNDIINKVMQQFTTQQPPDNNKPSCSEGCNKEVISEESESMNNNEDLSKLMTEVMKKVNNFEPSDSRKMPEVVHKDEDSGSVVKSIGGVITNVMKRFAGANNPVVMENRNVADVTTMERSIGTESPDVMPSSSSNEISQSTKRKKRARQESDSEIFGSSHKYLTRSRVKANELRRSHVQAPSDSVASFKKAKMS